MVRDKQTGDIVTLAEFESRTKIRSVANIPPISEAMEVGKEKDAETLLDKIPSDTHTVHEPGSSPNVNLLAGTTLAQAFVPPSEESKDHDAPYGLVDVRKEKRKLKDDAKDDHVEKKTKS
jgi:hypothetical protein